MAKRGRKPKSKVHDSEGMKPKASDTELMMLHQIITSIDNLDFETRKRVASYLVSRYEHYK